MKLDRNLNADGRGKYGLVLNRELASLSENFSNPVKGMIEEAVTLLTDHGIIDWGDTADTEFFVMRLRDRYADNGLHGYAAAAREDGNEGYAEEIEALADRAGLV
jgi:hypothetical protein